MLAFGLGFTYLPSANEVWGKVICLQVCVCPQGGCCPSMHCRWYPSMPCSRSRGGAIPACIAGGIPACLAAGLGGWRGIWSRSRPTATGEVEGGLVWGGGAWPGVCLLQGVPGGDTHPTTTAAGGTHPTGMHSCLWY